MAAGATRPFAFTEHGVLMAATVLNGKSGRRLRGTRGMAAIGVKRDDKERFDDRPGIILADHNNAAGTECHEIRMRH